MRKKTHLKILLFGICFIMSFSSIHAIAGTKVIDYGFESCTGYVFTTDYTSRHASGTEVVSSGDSDCGSRNAHSGTKYFHRNFYTGGTDACLGTKPEHIYAHCNLGWNGTFDNSFCPGGSKNTGRLNALINSDVMFTRFWFRTTGNWPNTGMGNMKFLRFYGNGGTGDPAGCFVHIMSNGYTFMIYDYLHYDWNYNNSGINWNDGNWHSICVKVELLNHTNTDPNLEITVWWDDWNMASAPAASEQVGYPKFGTGFDHIVFQSNWSATYPSSDMGIDLDDIELWDGMPTGPNPPKNLRKVPTS